MAHDEHRLFNIWEDTVDLRELLIGLAFGSALGFAAYTLSLAAFTRSLTAGAGVIKGYALMVGIAGCVSAAVVVGRFVRPKRLFRESTAGPLDREALVRALGLDPDEERQALDEAAPQVIREMQQLQIYDLFAEVAQSRKEPK